MPTRTLRSLLVVALLGALLAMAAVSRGQGPPPDRFAAALATQERHTARLLEIAGVVGTGVGLDAASEPAVVILTRAAGVAGLPAKLDGVPVVVRVTGPLTALHHKPGHEQGGGGGPPEPPPSDGAVSIGTSTGNANECSAGTIGARVLRGSNVYALSNNHVYARENDAGLGEQIVAPGLFDTSCAFDPDNVIGTLADYVAINFGGGNNTVDAAIALSSTAEIGNSTPADGYGTPTSATTTAAVGMAAQKYGRTTSLTKGTITAINVTVDVGYGSGVARFVNQIVFEGTKPVIKSGDSGSLLVTDPGRSPVGLLFAGNQSGKLAVANRIGDVLSAFGASVDGE